MHEASFKDGDCAIDTDICSHSGFVAGYDIRMVFRDWDLTATYYIPVRAPEKVRREVAEYICRVNWGLRYGSFKLDFKDGAIHCEIVIGADGVAANVKSAIGDCFELRHTIDIYLEGLMSVIAGGMSAADAYAEAIRKRDEPPPADGEVPSDPDAPAEGAAVETTPAAPEKEKKTATKRRGKKKPKAKKESDAVGYSLAGLNIQGKIPLEKIVAAVRKFKEGKKNPKVDTPRLNILLSGAPGSGKTAFVKYLAEEVGMPLRTVRASDLLCRYSGETEKRIAEAFREARENGEMLFLDEVDSFVQDRTGAMRSWEVTQVNELLQHMETFGGVMVGATNFLDNLDKAVLRRFTYKLKLDFLTDEGKGIFFERYFSTPLTAEEKIRLNAISNLTPGDFRTVREELFYLSDKETNAERLEALEAESAAKGRERARIGF